MLRNTKPQPTASSSSQSAQPKPTPSATTAPQNDPVKTGTMADAKDTPAGSQPKPVAGSLAVTDSHHRTRSDQMKRLADQISNPLIADVESTSSKRRKTVSGTTEAPENMSGERSTSAKSTARGEISVDEHATAGGRVDVRPGNTEESTDSDAERAELLEKIKVLKLRTAERKAKYGGNPSEIVKGYTVNYGELLKQADADDALVESFVSCEHHIIQEAAYNFAVFYEIKAYNVSDSSLPPRLPPLT